MKRIVILSLLALMLALTAFISIGKDNRRLKSDDKELALLWKDYESAREGDRPQRMMSLLSRIKEVSSRKRHVWDYYKACREYVEVGGMRNWKVRDSLMNVFHKEIAEFDEPLLAVLLMIDGSESADVIFDYACSEASRLKRTSNKEVYENLHIFPSLRDLDDVLVSQIDNDYEYVLWELSGMGKWRMNGAENRIFDELKSCVAEDYPKEGFAEWLYACNHISDDGGARYEEMKRLVSKYEGRAFSLVPLQNLMSMEFRLMQERSAKSEEYMEFRDSVLRCEKARKGYHGGIDAHIAECCVEFMMILNSLNSKMVQVSIENGSVEMALRNLDKVRLRLSDSGETIFETVVDNRVKSFYVYDTLKIELPAVNDGTYDVECFDGTNSLGHCIYDKYTLSMALRQSAGGIGAYVADYHAGSPVRDADLILYKGDRIISLAENVSLYGFTDLPEILSSILTNDSRTSGYYLQAEAEGPEGRKLLSRKIYVSSAETLSRKNRESRNAVVMTGCSAFNPGDTVCFKTIVYDVTSAGSMSVTEGTDIVARLFDPQGKVLSEIELKTNDFGSAAGRFRLDDVKRNGMFAIAVYDKARRIGSRSFRVDEFILPTFDLTFDDNDELYLPGDTVKVSGILKSFSGHSLSSAEVTAEIFMDGRLVSETPVAVSSEGTFELEFKAACGEEKLSAVYEIRIKVVDLTGETLEFSRYERVSGRLNMEIQLMNSAEGVINWPAEANRSWRRYILADDIARLQMEVKRFDGKVTDRVISYEVSEGGRVVANGSAGSGTIAEIDFSAMPSGLYTVMAKCDVTDGYGRVVEAECSMDVIRLKEDDKVLGASVENVIRVLPGDVPAVQFGAGNGPVWALFELFGDEGQLLDREMVYLDGDPGREGSLTTRTYDYKDSYPEGIRLNIFYFHRGRDWFWTREWRRPEKLSDVPLEITRFTDDALPSSRCMVSLKTSADVEVLASVFDASTEKIMQNRWYPVRRAVHMVPEVGVRSVCGRNTNGYRAYMGYGERGGMRKALNTFENAMMDNAGSTDASAAVEEETELAIREDFSTAIAFEPFVYPDSSGNAILNFTTSDKLSSFVVSLFAHDKNMNSSVLRRDMVVSLPVKVSVVPPEYLHRGDRYVLNAAVSNDSEGDVSGIATVEFYDGGDYKNARLLQRDSVQLTVRAGGVVETDAEIKVPALDTLGIKVLFKGGMLSDAIFLAVPVYDSEQTLMEAHSAVLLPGASEEQLLRSLRDSFVNVSSIGAEYSEVSIRDMLSQALPLVKEPGGMDVISHSEAMFVNALGGSLRLKDNPDDHMIRGYAEAAMTSAGNILACSNADGGFGWVEGMSSSPVITAVVLERFAGLRDRGVLSWLTEEMGEDVLDDYVRALSNAVKYLDEAYFMRNERPEWYGGLTLLQYMNVRSMYPGVAFEVAAIKKNIGSKHWREFVKEARSLLAPKQGKGWTEGAVLAKVQLISILDRLTLSDSGRALALSWGLKNVSRMKTVVDNELVSLCEYAVGHPSGGCYYPNAVQPWRGLLESEAYAHSMICNILTRKAEPDMNLLSDRIRIWLMLQKETQEWNDDPGFVEALASVYDGIDKVGDTKVLMLKKRYSKPFHEVKAAGNGMSVAVRYYKEHPADRGGLPPGKVELKPGDALNVGDRIVAEYSLWNQENRSFVCLSVPRAALFRPAEQLSGWEGGWCSPVMSGTYRIAPYCYREVKDDRSLYWMDLLPEEDCVLKEILLVTQEGEFVTPVAELECLYAAHYRANGSGGNMFEAK